MKVALSRRVSGPREYSRPALAAGAALDGHHEVATVGRVMTGLLQGDTELFEQFHGQRVVLALADGHGLHADLRTAGGLNRGESSPPASV